MAAQKNVISMLYVSKQTHADLSSSIYSYFELRLHPDNHDYKSIESSGNDLEFVHSFINNPCLARLRSLTSHLVTVTSPVSFHGAWRKTLHLYPQSFAALQNLIFFENNRLEYIDGLFADRDLKRAREKQKNAGVMIAKQHQKNLSWWAQDRGLNVTSRISLGPRDTCIHGGRYGGCKCGRPCYINTVCELTLNTKADVPEICFVQYADAFWFLGGGPGNY